MPSVDPIQPGKPAEANRLLLYSVSSLVEVLMTYLFQRSEEPNLTYVSTNCLCVSAEILVYSFKLSNTNPLPTYLRNPSNKSSIGTGGSPTASELSYLVNKTCDLIS